MVLRLSASLFSTFILNTINSLCIKNFTTEYNNNRYYIQTIYIFIITQTQKTITFKIIKSRNKNGSLKYNSIICNCSDTILILYDFIGIKKHSKC